MRILFITPRYLDRIQNGGEQWADTVVGSLRRLGHDVSIIGYRSRADAPDPHGLAAPIGETRTRLAPYKALFWGLSSLASGRPYTAQKWRTRRFRRRLRAALKNEHWDLAIIHGPWMSWTIDDLGGVPFVHLSPEAAHILYRDAASTATGLARLVYAREARLVEQAERTLAERAAATWCISRTDADHFKAWDAERLRTLTPLCRAEWSTFQQRDPPSHDLVLLGNWMWRPNARALDRFLEDVVPLLPSAWRIAIGGAARPAVGVPANVSLFGPVADACAFLSGGKRIAVPSTSSVGFNLKLLDAIASGRPVVADDTALALAGPVPSHVRGASGARAFADALLTAPEPDPAEVRAWMTDRQEALDGSIRESLARLSR